MPKAPVKTTVMRVPAEMAASVRQLAALHGETAGATLAQAWTEYLENHRDEFAATFSQLARVMRQGNSEALVAFLLDGAEDRARAAAERARR